MIRRINFTERKRINKEDVRITLHVQDRAPLAFTADIALDRYELQPDSEVVLEAYRHTSWMRFDFGNVRELTPPANLELRNFKSAVGVLFRLKVVQPSASSGKMHGRILAQANRIKPRLSGTERRQSLLEVDWGDFDTEVWRVEFDEDSDPVLRVNRKLLEDEASRSRMLRSDAFIALSMPAVFRTILSRIIFVDDNFDVADDECWQAKWIAFAKRLPGVSKTPDFGGDSIEPLEDWMDECVEAFGRISKSRMRFHEWFADES